MYPDFEKLVLQLAANALELEWLEFKQSLDDPEGIGQYVSALSNSAACLGQPNGFMVWGVEDGTHRIIGTDFDPFRKKKGNEPLENWLARLLSPRVDFRFRSGLAEGKQVVVLEIPAASHTPTHFQGEEYIRVGSAKKKLKDYPERARKLWARLTQIAFEDGSAASGVRATDVLSLLDFSEYFRLLEQPVPSTPEKIVERLEHDRLVKAAIDGSYEITNLGAITFAHHLKPVRLDRKSIRVITYAEISRETAVREWQNGRGYVAGFENVMQYILGQLPSAERISHTLRVDTALYPEAAVRELVANALIHQDFSITGTGPMVEIFPDRVEVTNPGQPLLDPARLLDLSARSRNEQLASLMRQFRYAEERGSGIDRVVKLAEAHQLPAPDFRAMNEHFVAILYAPRPLSGMTKEDRIRACYQHACLQWVARTQLTNGSLRARFGISEGNSAMASRIIADTETAGQIKKHNPESWSRKHASYVPYWA